MRHSKERKDRVVYLSDTTVRALRQHLSTRPDSQSPQIFTRQARVLTARTLERRLLFGMKPLPQATTTLPSLTGLQPKGL